MSINDNLKDHILDSIAEGVFTVDKNFKVNFFNKAAENITGDTTKKLRENFVSNFSVRNIACPIANVFKD